MQQPVTPSNEQLTEATPSQLEPLPNALMTAKHVLLDVHAAVAKPLPNLATPETAPLPAAPPLAPLPPPLPPPPLLHVPPCH